MVKAILYKELRYQCVIYASLSFLVWFLFTFITIIKRLQKLN